MNKKTLFSYSLLAASVCLTLSPALAMAEPSMLTQSAKASIEAPRQIILEQPGAPDYLRIKQQRGFDQTPLQSTGYWVKKGDVLTINVDYSGNVPLILDAFISVPHDRTHKYQHAQRQELNRGINTVSATVDGILYIANHSAPISSDIRINLQGGRPFPRFVLNKNSGGDWQRMLADPEMNTAPYVELLSNKMMITLRRDKAESFIQNGNPVGMLETWDNIVTWAEDQYGLTSTDIHSPHSRIQHRFHFVDGIQPKGIVNNDRCSGYMNAWSWRMQSCGEDGMEEVVNNHMLRTNSWGPWHELGHHFQMRTYTWDGMVEVSVNLTSLYVQRELGNPSRLETYKVWEEVFKYFEQAQRDYHQQDLFVKVAMLWQLDLTFGKDFYARLGKVYREIPENQQPKSSDAKVQRFILETSRLSGYDLTPFYEKWGLPLTQDTKDKIKQLSLPWMTDAIWENRDSRIKFDYSKSQEVAAPKVTLSRTTIDAIATEGSGYLYSVSASADQENVAYQWERVSGNDKITAKTPNAAKTDIVIPAGLTNTEATFRLTATNEAGKTGEAFVKVTVSAPQVVITGNDQMQIGKPITLTAKANFDSNQGNVKYLWSLTHNGTTIPDGISYNGLISDKLNAGNYVAHVTAQQDSGHRRAQSSHRFEIIGSGNIPSDKYPSYKEGTKYEAGTIVKSTNGGLYQCKPWPYTGWCSGAAWAYAPGTGLHWQEAWT
ncbi:hypothetical protein HW114_12785, partial [Serratia symbiotica]